MWSSGQYPNIYAGGNMQGQLMQPQIFNVQQAGIQAQYQNVLYSTVQMQMPVQGMQLIQEPMQEMQIMQMPVQEMQMVQEVQMVQQEMQLVQMPVQEVQMVPMQVPVQQMMWVPNPPPPPLRHRSETPEPEPLPKKERAAPPPPERERAPPPPPPEEPLIIYVERGKVKIVEVPYDQVYMFLVGSFVGSNAAMNPPD